MKKILIVIDMQEDFVTGALGSEAARAVVNPIGELAARYRAEGIPVFYTADTHTENEYEQQDTQESLRIPRHCVKDSNGWRIVDALAPGKDDVLVDKPGFLSLRLPGIIGSLDSGTVIELCGVCTDICVISNALHLRACYPGNRIVVRESCCAGTTPQNHEAALAVMRSCLIDIE